MYPGGLVPFAHDYPLPQLPALRALP